MEYVNTYNWLKNMFNQGKKCISLNESGMQIINMDFISKFHQEKFLQEEGLFSDYHIHENQYFNYPVFIPSGKQPNDKAIILVHGLNERTWYKHLSWAYSLCESTGKSVILFPISYHMNRGPALWTDPREMNKQIEIRKSVFPGIQSSSVINLALSERLTSVPQRFFMSGVNYAYDLIELTKEIRSGNHPLFLPGTQIDFFAYSIGVFFMQCLITANPDDFSDNSRFVFFAGGSLFYSMNGISKYIMDNKAFDRIHTYYMKEMEEEIKNAGVYSEIFGETNMGKAFRAMIRPDKFKKFRDKVLDYFKSRILVIALRDDKVVPLKGILELFGKNSNIKITHFKFPYIHENPFPVQISEIHGIVEKAFNEVFMRAGAFLV